MLVNVLSPRTVLAAERFDGGDGVDPSSPTSRLFDTRYTMLMLIQPYARLQV